MSKFIESLKAIERWFIKRQRILPWRDSPDIYRVWVSEIMLQQTQVKTVIPYFERFIRQFPNVQRLSLASEEDVLKLWAGLGYYARARNLLKAARIIVQSGGFPNSREEWLKLPGIGDYTAGAVLSIALDQVEPILDANIKRVIARLRRLKDTASDKKPFWRWSGFLVRQADICGIRPSLFNQALMELGALVCLPDSPMCTECPLSSICKSRMTGDMLAYPLKQNKVWISLSETVYCILKDSKILLHKDSYSRWRKGLWDFPKNVPEIFKRDNLKESIHEKLEIQYVVTNHRVNRQIIILEAERTVDLPPDYRWIELKNWDEINVPVGAPIKKTIHKLTNLLRAQ